MAATFLPSTHTPVQPGIRPADNVELRERIDDHLLDGPNIGDHVALPFSQIQDRIADDLAGAVIGDVAAAIGGIELDSGAAQRVFARQQIFGVAVAALRDHVRMLDEQELIGNQPALALFDQILLDGERVAIAHAPQVANFEAARTALKH